MHVSTRSRWSSRGYPPSTLMISQYVVTQQKSWQTGVFGFQLASILRFVSLFTSSRETNLPCLLEEGFFCHGAHITIHFDLLALQGWRRDIGINSWVSKTWEEVFFSHFRFMLDLNIIHRSQTLLNHTSHSSLQHALLFLDVTGK